MKTVKTICLAGFLLLYLGSFAQRVNYRDYKNQFSTKDYHPNFQEDTYIPLFAGFANYMFPCGGYLYVDEPLRGLGVLAAEAMACSVFIYGILLSSQENQATGQSPTGAPQLALMGGISLACIHVWSIFDVVKVAKIKNLAYQQQRSPIGMKLRPNLFVPEHNQVNKLGLGLCVSISL